MAVKRKRQALNGEEMKWSRREKKRKGIATKGSEMICIATAYLGSEKMGKAGQRR